MRVALWQEPSHRSVYVSSDPSGRGGLMGFAERGRDLIAAAGRAYGDRFICSDRTGLSPRWATHPMSEAADQRLKA